MKKYYRGSKRYFVNLFADFILTELDHSNNMSEIQVTDCSNFLVIGGKTESKNILDMGSIKIKFVEKYKNEFEDINILKLNIIDLIVYDVKIDVPDNISFGYFYNSDRPIYHQSQLTPIEKKHSYSDYNDEILFGCTIDQSKSFETNIKLEPLHISSEFPHGYSINNLRNKFYYSEYLSFNLFTIFGISKIKFNWIGSEVNMQSDSFIDSKSIDSIMKDVFDFNITLFNEKIKEYQILNDILLPLETKPWMNKDKVSELFII